VAGGCCGCTGGEFKFSLSVWERAGVRATRWRG
jgi:hypothetical protein